jgi:catalase-peroxidase
VLLAFKAVENAQTQVGWSDVLNHAVFEGRDRSTGEVKWTGARVASCLRFEQLRARSEVYARYDSKEAFVIDFGYARR